MPRPITKKDANDLMDIGYDVHTTKALGYYVFDRNDHRYPYAYQMSNDGRRFCWITTGTFNRRKRLGHPQPRKKRLKLIMREPDFGLEEMALAEAIINGG